MSTTLYWAIAIFFYFRGLMNIRLCLDKSVKRWHVIILPLIAAALWPFALILFVFEAYESRGGRFCPHSPRLRREKRAEGKEGGGDA